MLLGPYKYLVHSLMGRLSTKEKEEVEARLVVFNFSGFEDKLGYNLCRHFRSFVGRDYKALAQVALFVLGPYMTESERIVWLALSKVCFADYKATFHCLSSQVFRVTYCQKFHLSSRDECQRVCEGFVSSIKEHFPHLQKNVKIHLLLHLIDNMVDFGPTSSFNTERYIKSIYPTPYFKLLFTSFVAVKHSTP